MKFKNYINKFVAIVAVIALVGGFQLNLESGSMETIPTIIGIEEAYAGPCGREGCIGGPDLCVTVSWGWGFFKRTCYTTVSEQLIDG